MNIYSLADMTIQQRIGEKLKRMRLRQNITQEKLAEDAQVSLSSIKKIEKGKMGSFDNFLRLLRVLGTLDTLIPLVEEEEMSPNEYYKFVTLAKKKTRKRASSKDKNKDESTNENIGSAW
jgi:transcriptional regulator with XRE-family HTH domain